MLRKKNLIIAALCNLVFGLFSFSYLGVMHGELIRCVYRSLRDSDVSYTPWIGALVITLLLALVRWGLNLLTGFKGRWMAVSFFPVFLILVLLTSWQPVADGGEDFVWQFSLAWWWPLVLMALYGAGGWLYRKKMVPAVEKSLGEMLIPNILVMLLFTYSTGSIGNDHDLLHNELTVAQKIREGDYAGALLVGKKSLESSQTLMALRALALSMTDSLPQCLFVYPQVDGAEGLFMDESRGRVSPLSNEDIFRHLGGEARLSNEIPVRYLRRLCEKDSLNSPAVDYFLCSLLLERQLELFVRALDGFYRGKRLPRYYQEALLLYEDKEKRSASLSSPVAYDRQIEASYAAFKELQREYSQETPRRNYTRRQFGDSYWWYYWYGE